MFTPGRYVVVDDQRSELRVLVETLHDMNAPCLGMLMVPERGLADRCLEGVRILFMDLHLQGAAVGGAGAANYALIADILERCTVPASGPYILVLWTNHAEEKKAFSDYILKAVPVAHLPLAVLSLDKRRYLAPEGNDLRKLRVDLEASFESELRLKALLAWERDVLAAAGATLAEVGALIPEADRTVDRYPESLDQILSLLAVAAAGRANAERDPRAAVSAALAPVLADRIVSNAAAATPGQPWTAAVTKTGERAALDPGGAARMNAMIHLASPAAGELAPSDWGALADMPERESTDEALLRRFALDRAGVAALFRLPATVLAATDRLCLLRTGAACDAAQGRTGPMLFVLCLHRPVSGAGRVGRAPDSEKETPTLALGEGEPFVIVANVRMQVSLVEADLDGWNVPFRLREQLLAVLAGHAAAYVTRPGILSFKAGR